MNSHDHLDREEQCNPRRTWPPASAAGASATGGLLWGCGSRSSSSPSSAAPWPARSTSRTARPGNGESGHAAQVIDKAGFKKSADEMVLITSPTGTVKSDGRSAPRSTTSSPRSTRTARSQKHRRSRASRASTARSPTAATRPLVTFEVHGDETQADKAIVPVMDSVDGPSADRTPASPSQEFGEASAAHVLNDKIGKDFEHARTVSLPLTLIILLFAFGAMVAAGVPVLLAFSAVLATFGLNSLFSHVMPSTRDQRRDHPDDRHGGRRGLLALLPPPRAGRAGAPRRRPTGPRIKRGQGRASRQPRRPATSVAVQAARPS